MFVLPGVHHQSSEEVRPGDVVNGVLFGGDGPCCDLGVQVVTQHTQETLEIHTVY